MAESNNMWRITKERFEKPKEGGAYISERTRIVPGRHIHPKSVFIDLGKVDKHAADRIRKVINSSKGKVIRKGREYFDYGIAEQRDEK